MKGRTIAMPAEPMSDGKVMQDNWQHDMGEVCFDRTIDPERYPPFSKLKNL